MEVIACRSNRGTSCSGLPICIHTALEYVPIIESPLLWSVWFVSSIMRWLTRETVTFPGRVSICIDINVSFWLLAIIVAHVTVPGKAAFPLAVFEGINQIDAISVAWCWPYCNKY
jgi:hypothetical protein